MKVMWVTMAPIGKAGAAFSGKRTQSGGWIDATMERLSPYLQEGSLSLHVVALGNRCDTVISEEDGVTYHMINIERHRGKAPKKTDVARWSALIDKIRPDIIQVWGTEFTFGESIREAAKDIPVCYYIQGVMNALAQHPAGDIPLCKLFRMTGILSIPKFRSMKKEIRDNRRHCRHEAEMVAACDGILCDNLWTRAQYSPYTKEFYPVCLALNRCFFDAAKWTWESCRKKTLFTVAGGASPIKGVHNAVLAVALLKKKHPEIRLNIPGNVSSAKPHFLYDSIYIRHIKALIKKHGLQENVVFLGQLSLDQMAEQMRSANAFVMPSCVETHSSTLREAMAVGCPVISTTAGSAMEFVRHGENGFLYRYDDVYALAHYIDLLFSDAALSQKLGAAAASSLKEAFPQEEIGSQLMNAYSAIIAKKRGLYEQN